MPRKSGPGLVNPLGKIGMSKTQYVQSYQKKKKDSPRGKILCLFGGIL